MKPHPLLLPLETERFILAPLGRFGAFRISYRWNKDPEIMRNLFYSPRPIKPWKWFRKHTWANGKTKFSHAIRTKSGDTIGMHIVVLYPHRSAMLTIAVHDHGWWGKKVVEEVRRSLIDHMFAKDVIDRICCEVSPRNMPSVFNYRKLGFAHVGTLHKARCDPTTGITSDTLVFELLRDDWTSQRSER